MSVTVTSVAAAAWAGVTEEWAASEAATSEISVWSMTKRSSAQALVPVAASPRTAAPPMRRRRRVCFSRGGALRPAVPGAFGVCVLLMAPHPRRRPCGACRAALWRHCEEAAGARRADPGAGLRNRK